MSESAIDLGQASAPRSHRDRSLLMVLSVFVAAPILVRLLLGDSQLSSQAFLPIHTVMELFSVVVSMLVFAIGWHSSARHHSQRKIVLACGFLTVGLVDVGHLLSFPGMPVFVTPSSAEKGINFFLIARLIAALILLYFALGSNILRKVNQSRYAWLSAALILAAFAYWLILVKADLLPATFVPGRGLTKLKIVAEYFLILINALGALVCFRRYRSEGSQLWILLTAANALMAFSEFFFTIYSSVNSLDNLIGHVYKVAAYFLIYRALFAQVVRDPYLRIAQLKHEVELAEKRWQLAVEGSGGGVWDVDFVRRTTYRSRRLEELLGYGVNELPTESRSIEVHPDDRARADAIFSSLESNGEYQFSDEYRLRTKPGSYKWFMVSGRVVDRDASGTPTRAIGTMIDMSPMRTAQEQRASAIRERDELSDQYRRMVDSVPDCVFAMLDLRGHILLVSPGSERLLQYKPEQLIGQHHSIFFATEELVANTPARLIEEALAQGSSESEGWCACADGSRFWARQYLSIVTDESGNTSGFYRFLQDTSKRKQMEDRLRNDEARLRGILESAMDAVISIDSSQHILGFNAAAERMFGYSAAQMLGQPLAGLIPDRFRQGHARSVSDFGEHGITVRAMGPGSALRGLRASGEEFPIEASISQLFAQDEHVFTAIVRDITERQRVELEVAEKNRELRALAMRIEDAREEERRRLARELHDQMGSILTALRMDVFVLNDDIQIGELSKQRVKAMSGLLDNASIATRNIINELRPAVLDGGLVPAIEWQAGQLSERTGIRYSLSYDSEDVPITEARAVTVFRMVQEALTNVVKHARATELEINLSFDDQVLTVEIYDNGIGVSDADLSKKGHYGIVGMRERVLHFGGEVQIALRPRGGTVVTITMPLTEFFGLIEADTAAK